MSVRGLKRVFGFSVSPSPERDSVTGKRRRVKSPSPPTNDDLEELRQQYLARQQEEIAKQDALLRVEALQLMHKEKVNEIIDNLNKYLYSFFGEDVNVDAEDPNIRFLIGMIVKSSKAGQNIYEKLSRSKLLLTAIANVIINRARRGAIGFGNVVERLLPVIERGIAATGSLLLRLGAASGRAAKRTAYSVATSMRNYFTPRQQAEALQQGIVAYPPRQSMHNMASAAYESAAAGLPAFYDALTRVLGRVYDLLEPCVSSTARSVVSLAKRSFTAVCAYLTPYQAVDQAVSEVVNRSTPPQQEEEEESICAICMEGAQENHEPLGYVIKHHDVRSWHPNRFHRSCLLACPGNKCPICRAAGPVWGEQLPQRQDGGGSKKYRSKTRTKSKSKSKSKSRRYLSKPHKSRKARKRVRHASSRRK